MILDGSGPFGRPNRWRLRENLIFTAANKLKLSTALKHFLADNGVADMGASIRWEALKAMMRGEFIALVTANNKEQVEKRASLEVTMQDLEKDRGSAGLACPSCR